MLCLRETLSADNVRLRRARRGEFLSGADRIRNPWPRFAPKFSDAIKRRLLCQRFLKNGSINPYLCHHFKKSENRAKIKAIEKRVICHYFLKNDSINPRLCHHFKKSENYAEIKASKKGVICHYFFQKWWQNRPFMPSFQKIRKSHGNKRRRNDPV